MTQEGQLLPPRVTGVLGNFQLKEIFFVSAETGRMSRSWRWEREEGRAAWQREKHMQGPEVRAWPAHCAAGIWTRLPVEGREQEVRGARWAGRWGCST